MRISTNAYMAVEILARLSAQGTDTPCTTQGLAEWINRPLSRTEALMARLREAGFVRGRHGSGGGYTLARPANGITVAEVLKALDEPLGLPERHRDAIGLESEASRDLHGADLVWELLKSHILVLLSGISLADLAPEMDRITDHKCENGEPRKHMNEHGISGERP